MNICQGHVLDEPEDLMYAGDQHWIPGKLDIGRHDYYAMKNPSPGAVDVSRSAFLTPQSGRRQKQQPPPGWPLKNLEKVDCAREGSVKSPDSVKPWHLIAWINATSEPLSLWRIGKDRNRVAMNPPTLDRFSVEQFWSRDGEYLLVSNQQGGCVEMCRVKKGQNRLVVR